MKIVVMKSRVSFLMWAMSMQCFFDKYTFKAWYAWWSHPDTEHLVHCPACNSTYFEFLGICPCTIKPPLSILALCQLYHAHMRNRMQFKCPIFQLIYQYFWWIYTALEDLKMPSSSHIPFSHSRKLLQVCPYTLSIVTDPFHALQYEIIIDIQILKF